MHFGRGAIHRAPLNGRQRAEGRAGQGILGLDEDIERAPPVEGIRGQYKQLARRADATRREEPCATTTYLPNQSVALVTESPMTWYVHVA